jgi:predicted nucleotide-binding protein
MPVTRLFIGSSSAARSQAKRFVEKFTSTTLKFIPWWEAFEPGKTLLEDLDSIKRKIDGAVMLFSPESETKVKARKVSIPNLNVVFEFGYFYGVLGKKKVIMLKYGEFYLPSDFGGYVYINGSEAFTRGRAIPINKRTEKEFSDWVQKL